MSELSQGNEYLINGECMAVAYSGFREGQHPDRGDGANNPSDDQILEDLRILAEHGFRLVRLYDSGQNSRSTVRLIEENKLPIKVLLGAWLKAEISNHESCSWLDEPITDEVLIANALDNAAELRRSITLANQYQDIVSAVNIGNEALVDWNDHRVPVSKVIDYVRHAKSSIKQPVTVAENYEWWIRDGAGLAEEVDFVGVHTYPAWEYKTIDEALGYTIQNLKDVCSALPGKPIAVLEAGWASTASEFGVQANETNQARHFQELKTLATESNVTFFFFEAFDEPWKGNPDDDLGAEKHWGIFYVDRRPKLVMQSADQTHSGAGPVDSLI
jgi:exo-beta-1,3-glucanase (GH17 family)